MSGSGSMEELNFTNETVFSCQDSELSNSNLTNVTFWKIAPDEEIGAIVAGVLILIFFLVGTVWNLFIIITYLVRRDLLKEPGNVLLFNAAITDLVICITTMVFTYVTAFGREFIFGYKDVTRCIMCGMSGFFLVFLILVSLHLLSALSVDRFILLSRPLRYKRIMSWWKSVIICIVIYIVCFVLAILPLLGFGHLEFNPRFASCVPRFTPPKNLYYVVIIAFESLIPIIILAITNVWTYRIVSKFLKRNFRRRSTYRKRGEEHGKEGDESAKYQRQQNQLVKVFGALFIANIISYTPTITTIFVFAFLTIIGKDSDIPSEVYILGFVSFLMNPVLHPIIESFFVKDLRYQVKRAKTGIRRVSTILYRQTTLILSPAAVDEANRNMDKAEGTRGGTMQMHSTNSMRHNGKGVNSIAPVTDIEYMQNSISEVPEDEEVMEANGTNGIKKGIEGGCLKDSSPEILQDGRMLRKERRSVTFQESSMNEMLDPKEKELLPPASRSLGSNPANVEPCSTIVEEIPDIADRESQNEQANGSVLAAQSCDNDRVDEDDSVCDDDSSSAQDTTSTSQLPV